MTAEVLPGAILGRHRLARIVGGGARGLVYEAFDPLTGDRVAIRTFQIGALGLPQALRFEEQLRAAARAAGQLQHPNIVAVHGCDRQGPIAWLTLDFVDGEPLDHYLQRVGRLPALQALALLARLLSALAAAHAHGIVHGRIAPKQLLVCPNGQLKLTGLGVPRSAAAAADLPDATRAYLAPEQLRGLPPERASDVYSAAVLAYEVLTGVLPARGPGHVRPLPPRALRPDLPAALDGVFERALAIDPQARQAGALVLFADLAAALEPPPGEQADPAPPRPVAARPPAATPPPAQPVALRPAVSHRRRLDRQRLRTRLAVSSACVVGVAAVVGMLLAGELRPAGNPAGRPDPGPVTMAPSSPGPEPVAALAAPEPVTALAEPQASVPVHEDVASLEPPAPAAGPADDAPAIRAAPARQLPARLRQRADPVPGRWQRGGPEGACRDQQLAITREICKVAQCATDEFRGHPVCVRLHVEQRRRDQIAEQAARTR